MIGILTVCKKYPIDNTPANGEKFVLIRKAILSLVSKSISYPRAACYVHSNMKSVLVSEYMPTEIINTTSIIIK